MGIQDMGLDSVRDLIDRLSKTEDEPEPLMAEIQSVLRSDNEAMQYAIKCVQDRNIDPEFRSLLLETVAGARNKEMDDSVREAILFCLDDPDSNVRFMAVAAEIDLTQQNRAKLVPKMELLAENDPDSDVRRAAKAFLDFEKGN